MPFLMAQAYAQQKRNPLEPDNIHSLYRKRKVRHQGNVYAVYDPTSYKDAEGKRVPTDQWRVKSYNFQCRRPRCTNAIEVWPLTEETGKVVYYYDDNQILLDLYGNGGIPYCSFHCLALEAARWDREDSKRR